MAKKSKAEEKRRANNEAASQRFKERQETSPSPETSQTSSDSNQLAKNGSKPPGTNLQKLK